MPPSQARPARCACTRPDRHRRHGHRGLALVALIGLRAYGSRAIGLVWLCIGVGMVDTVNAVIQSVRFSVFDDPLGVNWVIVTMYVPALLVSSLLVVLRVRR